MENPKKVFFTLLILFISCIILFNYFINIQQAKDREAEKKYFEGFDLKLKGIVCSVEKQTDTYKYIIGLKVLKSNYENYPVKTSSSAVFCFKNIDYAAFADHHKNYEIGDTVLIGYDKTNLIECLNDSLKFVRKRDDMLLYNIASPNSRMKEIVALGCGDK